MARVDTEDEVWDSIVIGSGMGGLSAASLLAQCQTNHRVLVTEQNPYHAGGCCQSFERNGYPFAVGIHYLTDMGEGDPKPVMNSKQMLDALTMEGDPIEWTKMPDNFVTLMIGKDELKPFPIHASRLEESLVELFPDEKEAIHDFMQQTSKASQAWERAVVFKVLPRPLVSFLLNTGLHRWFDKGYHFYSRQSVQKIVESVTDNADLRCLLEYLGSESGEPPCDAPFFLQALIIQALKTGFYYPTRGAGTVPEKIGRAIKDRGGEIRVNAKVDHILIEKGKAVGVELVDGKRIRAKQVISDAGYVNTFRMVPDEYQPNFLKPASSSTQTLQNSPTGACLYVGLKGDFDTDYQLPSTILMGLPHNNIPALHSDCPTTLEALKDTKPEELGVFVSSPSAKDSSWKKMHPGKTTLEILAGASWKAFADLVDSNGEVLASKKDEYEKFKRTFADSMWTRARQILVAAGASNTLPKSLDEAEVAELATPLTFAHYLGSDQGAWYGLTLNRKRFSPRKFYLDLRPDYPKLPGLYFTGQDACCNGVIGALFGGYICAGKVLGEPNPQALRKLVTKNRAVASKP